MENEPMVDYEKLVDKYEERLENLKREHRMLNDHALELFIDNGFLKDFNEELQIKLEEKEHTIRELRDEITHLKTQIKELKRNLRLAKKEIQELAEERDTLRFLQKEADSQ